MRNICDIVSIDPVSEEIYSLKQLGYASTHSSTGDQNIIFIITVNTACVHLFVY